MVARTEECEVRAAIETDPDISINTYMTNAGIVTDQVSSEATKLGITVTTGILKLIETYISAHFYALFEQQSHEEDTGKARNKFQGKTNMYFEATLWGQQAIALDPTGFLSSSIPVTVLWAGTERT